MSRQRSPTQAAGFSQVPVPGQLAPEFPDAGLTIQPDQRLQAQFDGFPLCLEACCLESIFHQCVVDHDVGSHGTRQCVEITLIIHMDSVAPGRVTNPAYRWPEVIADGESASIIEIRDSGEAW